MKEFLHRQHQIGMWAVLSIACVGVRDLFHGIIPAWLGGTLILTAVGLLVFGTFSHPPDSTFTYDPKRNP